MDHKSPPNNHRRLLILIGLLAAALTVYVGVLYNIQVNQHDYYLAKSIRTITRVEKVEASRGVITDRNGRELVSSRSSYNLTFDSSLLSEGDDENLAILRLIKLCQSRQVQWTDNLPITSTAPFSYTLDTLDSTQRSRFADFLQKDLKRVSTNLSPDGITEDLLVSLGLDADTLVELLREKYEIPGSFSLADARAVIGVQYELSIRQLVSTTDYAMVEDIDSAMISLLNDGAYAGARITSSSVREYKTDSAAHILGTVGPIWREEYLELKDKGYGYNDRIGRSGVELAFEEYLKGTDGKRIVSTNAEGKITGEYYEKEPQPGSTVELTIDLNLQKSVEDALAQTVSAMSAKDGNTIRGAGATVIKVGTGEVLALASYPDFDLSTYNQEYNILSTDPAKPLWNRATMGTYAPGSTFKPLTAVAALMEGIITPYQKLKTTGHWTYPGDPNSYANCWIYNSSRGNHGSINVSEAITVSCNYFFAQMGYYLGLDKLNEYARAFGLGEHTGIEIGDAAGNLTENRVGENQAPWAAFGQASYLFTPIQLANYIATLVSGGKHCEAHLLKAVKSYDNTQVLSVGNSDAKNTVDISGEALTAVKKGMHDLTTTGSLAPYFKDCVVDAGAKTGTAQVNKDTENNGVFVCFAPYDDPEIAVAIVIEQGGSGSALASTAVNILNAYFTADEIGAAILGENQLMQ